MGLLEKTLSHSGHCLFVFSNFLRNSNKHAKFWRQINVLSLLFDFKQRLVKTHNLLVILRAEILNHRDGLASLTLLEATGLWTHIPTNGTDFVGFVMTIAGHDNCMFEFVVNGFLGFSNFWRLAGITLPFCCEPDHLFINQFETIVDWKIFTDIINDQIDSALKYPRGCEEAGPGLNCVIENLRLRRHEETGVSTDLAKFWISHLCFDNWVDEA